MVSDQKILEALQDIRANTQASRESLDRIGAQLTWTIFLLLPILLANLIAAAMLLLI